MPRGERHRGGHPKKLLDDARADFLHDLAGHLGRTVEELLYGSPAFRPLSEWELRRWMARDSWSPIGGRRDDMNAALIVQTIQSLFDEPGPLELCAVQWDADLYERRIQAWREKQKQKVRSVVGTVARRTSIKA